ncbi:MAG: lamin tail domain-containing protein [Kiritimatiellae bacterium]|nr:lamin tail domain-containing protein [Kiritimatiellia bacterium]
MSNANKIIRCACLFTLFTAGTASAATLVNSTASGWRYAKGTAEASPTDRTAWRTNGFDHAAWPTGAAPFRYGTGTGGTLLDMQNNYSCVFLRRQFTVADVAAISALQLQAQYDDGFVAWINGERVADDNAPADAVYNALADDDHPADTFRTFSIDKDPARLLVNGVNVLAVQAFNVTRGSSDFHFDARLVTAVADTRFSHDRGFYDAAFTVTISTRTPGATIRYTTDGTKPSATAGTIGGTNTAVPIATTTCLRALAIKGGDAPTDVDTQTYIFAHDILAQTGPNAARDGMDPAIVNDPEYGPLLTDSLLAIPTLSIVGRPADILDAKSVADGYEAEVSTELIHPDGKQGFQIDCGCGPGGMSGHVGWTDNKQQFNLFFRSAYGASKLRYKVFDTVEVDRFDGLRLRGAGNDRWSASWMNAEYGIRAQFIRDEWGRRLQQEAGHVASHGRWMHVYINGYYWGIYNVVHKPNESFMATFYGGEKEDYDVLKQNKQIVGGDATAWNEMESFAKNNNLALTANYEKMRDWLDVTQFMDYHIFEIWGPNLDWVYSRTTGNNWRAGRKTRNRHAGDPQFTFFVWDYEFTMEMSADAGLTTDISGTVGVQGLHERLRANAEYKREFGDRVHRYFFNGGLLTPAACADRYRAAAAEIDLAIVAESARWGDTIAAYADAPRTRATWRAFKQHLLDDWFPTRSANVLQQFRNQGLYPSVTAPSFDRHGGEVAAGFQLHISAPAGTITYTTDGTDPRLIGGAVNGSAVSGASPCTVTINRTTHVKARARNGSSWSALNEATFHVAFAASDLRLTELMYHPADDDPLDPAYAADDFEFIEFRNTGGAVIDLSGFEVEGVGPYVFAAGTRVEAGAYLVLCRNPAAFASRYPGVPWHGTYAGSLANDGEKLRVKDPAGNTVLSVQYEDRELNMTERDLGFWPLAADGLGYSLVNVNPAGDPDNPANWRASTHRHGSPGAADPAPAYGLGIVINEVLAHSDLTTGDAIELYNTGDSPIDIGGWYLSDSFDRLNPDAGYTLKKFQIPAGTVVPAYGYVVFHQMNAANPFGFGIKEDGSENVYLAAGAGGHLTGFLIGLNLPATANGVCVGRHQTSEGLDFAVMAARTLGRANSGPQLGPIVINEIMYDPPEPGVEYVELKNISGQNVDIGGWDLEGAGSYVFPAGTVVQAGGYLVLVDTNATVSPAAFRAAHGMAAGVPVLGHNFDLGNTGEGLRLERPNAPVTDPDVFLEKVCYNDKSPWPTEAAGKGPSLERHPPEAYGSDPLHWRTGNIGGTPGAANTFETGLAVLAGSAWKYHAAGIDLGTAWRSSAYNDAGWPGGDAALGYADDPAALEITTLVPYGPNPAAKHPTTYFRKEFSVNDDPADITDLMFAARYDDGFAAYVNGVEVLRKYMDTGGPIAYTNWAQSHAGASWEESIDLTAHKDKLVRGKNLLAVELHQAGPGSTDIVWDAKLTYALASLPTLEPPTIHPNGGPFSDPVAVTISNTTAGVQIRYTTDGSTPTAGATLYSGAFAVGVTTEVKARAWKSGWNPSPVATATFTFQPRSVRFSAPSSNARESDGTVWLAVELSSASSATVTVDYAVTGGSATAGADYLNVAGTLTFGAGQTALSVALTVLDDIAEEDNETVTVTLANPAPAGAVVGSPAVHTCTILDDDVLFVAYNDLNWQPPQPDTHITTYSPFAVNGWQTSGELVDYADGAGVGVSLTLSGGTYSSGYPAQGADADPGTPAHDLLGLGSIVSGTGLASGGDITMTFTGLNAAHRYEITLFGNRNEPGYTARTGQFIITDVAAFTNTSSAGVLVSSTALPQDTAESHVGWNTIAGEVVQFSDISPGADGDMTVTMTSANGGRYVNAIRLKAVRGSGGPARIVKICKGAAWKYRAGTSAEADPASRWRTAAFDDSGWAAGGAPIGYGTPNMAPIVTVLDMQGNYSSVFLRRTFTLADPRLVSELNVNVDFDDGFILWINGQEVHRQNVAGAAGEFVAHDSTATASQCSTWAATLSGETLPALAADNAVAVQVFNASLAGSSDCGIDVELAVVEGSSLPSTDDTDKDGMPDDWETLRLLGAGQPFDGDYDGDGFLNIDEWIAGTDPARRTSYLALRIARSGTGVIVELPTVAAAGTGYLGYSRYYTLQACDLLAGAQSWLTVPGYDRVPGNGATVYYTNGLAGGLVFYRARVWLEEE